LPDDQPPSILGYGVDFRTAEEAQEATRDYTTAVELLRRL
jgi:hypothetical protein